MYFGKFGFREDSIGHSLLPLDLEVLEDRRLKHRSLAASTRNQTSNVGVSDVVVALSDLATGTIMPFLYNQSSTWHSSESAWGMC